jgi:AcrR family transcriptional regulator
MPKVSPEYSDARRRQILDAALECFAKQGFHGTTMKDIIRASGLSAGAIYNYFSAKGEIVAAIARERHASENALLSSASDESDKPLDLHGLARAFFGSFASTEHRDARRVGVEVWAEALRNPDVLESVRRGVDEPRHLLARIIAECQERDELPAHLDPDGFARVMIAIFQGFVLQQAWDPETDSDQYLAAVDVILSALSSDQRG